MSTKLYKDGLTGFQDVLDAQRSLLAAESKLDEAHAAIRVSSWSCSIRPLPEDGLLNPSPDTLRQADRLN